MHRVTRRGFLRLGVGAAIALGAPPILAGCGGEKASPKPTARVAAIRGNDLYAMTREALEAVGGAQAVVNPGETVFIKPNMVTLPWANLGRNPFIIGECTKPEIVIAIAEECLRAGAGEVIVGDASQVPRFSWEQATTLDGSTSLAAEAEEVPSSTSLGKIAVSSLVARADRVISVPVLKTHSWAQLTLSLKNFVGVTPLARYGANPEGAISRIVLHTASEGIEQVFLDIVGALRPDLAVIDASICVEGNGPSVGDEGGVTVDMRDRLGSWLLLASTDLVAADATAARVINQDVSGVRQLRMAFEQGLGEVREDSIEMVGERLSDLRVDWIPAEPSQPATSAVDGPGASGYRGGVFPATNAMFA